MYFASPPWHDDEATADRIWRVIVAEVGPQCDVLWLRFGNLADLEYMVPPEQFQRLEELVGPYWGVPDPAPPPAESVESVLGGMLGDIAADFAQAGFTAPTGPAPKYIEYGFAVVPVTQDLVDLLVSMRAVDPRHVRGLCERLADHWSFRRGEQTLLASGTGMDVINLHLTPGEAEALRAALAGAGLDPAVMEER